MTDDKVIPLFANICREIDDLPKEEALAICKSVIDGLQKEMFRLMKELAAKEVAGSKPE